jgi:ABC-type multidrug transport system, ATPase component
MQPAVTLTDVSYRYGGTTALREVSLSVSRGSVLAVVGPNGAGKTTLVRAVAGVIDPSGEVMVDGDSAGRVDRRQIGILPQAFTPARRLTPRELIRYHAARYDAHPDPAAVCGRVGIGPSELDRPFERLSGGQQRRVCVAMAIAHDPALLLLDEPTAGIDPAGRRALWDELERIREAGTTMIITSHSFAEVDRLADEVCILDDGAVLAAGTPADLIAAVAGGHRLQVTPAPPSLPPMVPDAELIDGTLCVVDCDLATAAAVLRWLEEMDTIPRRISWDSSSLADVYTQLTEAG